MKKIIFISALMLLCLNSFSVSPEYHDTMLSNLKALDKANTAEDFMTAARAFERISRKEQKEWLPLYYSVYAYIQASFRIQNDDTKDQLLVKADTMIEKALQLNKNESELYALKGFYYCAYISIAPMMRGMMHSGDARAMFTKAEKINPKNPRAYYLDAMFILNTPAFFGGGEEAAKPMFKEAKEKYDSFVPADELWPNWGKEDCIRRAGQ